MPFTCRDMSDRLSAIQSVDEHVYSSYGLEMHVPYEPTWEPALLIFIAL